MLTLKRKEGQAIWVGDVRVLVWRIGAREVRISFEGPRSVPIVCEELLERPTPGVNGHGQRNGQAKRKVSNWGA